MDYIHPMLEIIQSDEFAHWLSRLRDRTALARIAMRIDRAYLGNLGDWKFLRDGVSEMRVDVGQGYRMYFTRRGNTVVILLCGGDKRTQDADIQRAVELAKRWE